MSINRFISLSIVVILTLNMTSCVNKKENIYCFSIVFDRSDSNVVVSLYCKEFSDNKNKIQRIDIKGENFAQTMCSINDQKYDIYLNSTEIMSFANNITHKDILEISAVILNNMNYKTDVKVYLPKNETGNTLEHLDKISGEVCDKESSGFLNSKECIPFLKFIRKIESDRVN